MNEKKIIAVLWKLFGVGLIFVPIYIFSVQVNFYNLYGGMPSLDLVENPRSELASELYSMDGALLGKYFRYNRSAVTYEEIPAHLIHALLASEDYCFKQHCGIYLRGLLRAFLLSVLLRQNKGGGSTLTQQLAKNLFEIRKEVDYKGKCSNIPFLKLLIHKTKEWILAVQLERAYTKEEIMAMYLNTVTFGSNAYGLKAAARTFFNKSPAELRLEEASLLIGMLRAPTRYSPVYHPERAKQIRNVVLSQMVRFGNLKQSEYNLICEMPIHLSYQEENYEQGIAPYFRAMVRNFLLKWAQENGYDLFADGLRIYTTIDSRIQAHAETALKEHMKLLQHRFDRHWKDKNPWIYESGQEIEDYIEHAIKRTDIYRELLQKYGADSASIDEQLHTPIAEEVFSWNGAEKTMITPWEKFKQHRRILQAGCMAMDPHTGYIKAWVGGIDFKHFKYDHVKQGKRQAGSTFKPIVYTIAFDNGYLPSDMVVDEPVTFILPSGEPWTPRNAWERYDGKQHTLQEALHKSYNSITCYLMKRLTPQLVVDYAQRMGIKGPFDPVPSIAFGTTDVSIYEMAGAYSTFLNKGVWTEPFFITHISDKHGNVIQSFTPQHREAIHEETADLMTYMLRGEAWSVAAALKEDNEIAGKTGTTDNHSDGWFIGLTQNLCVGVWVGGEERCIRFRDFLEGAGYKVARPMWERFMLKLYNDPDIGYKKGPLLDNNTLSEKVKKIIQNQKKPSSTHGIDGHNQLSASEQQKKIDELDINEIM